MFSRLSCHFCGKRSKYSKGTTEFQCTKCEAVNFYDIKGVVVDTPASIAAPPHYPISDVKPFQTFTRTVLDAPGNRQDETFCKKCLNNQRMFMESLSNYLPDENHPEYQAYEDALPQFKKQLEERYPQVCKKCAPKAQQKMFEADYYGMAEHAGKLADNKQKKRARGRSGSPRGQRDDWSKWTMRFLLGLVGVAVYVSLLAQTAWHTYAILSAIFNTTVTGAIATTDFAFEPTWKDCAQQSLFMRFDTSCYHLFDRIIRSALLTSLCLLWYNPGHKAWWHDTHKMEAVHGQREHLFIQAILLVVRTIAWFKLSDSTVTASLNTQQLLAAHGFMISFQILCQWLSEKVIESKIWKIKGKIMPRPSEQDVFGPMAGPADEQYARQASSKPPLRLFPRNEKPFNIESLAPRPLHTRGYSKLEFAGGPPPSPPDSQSVSDDGELDASNNMDWQPSLKSQMPGAPIDRTFRPKNYESRRPQTRSIYNYGTAQPSGWGAMRSEVFDIEDATRAADERKRREAEERARLRYEPPVEQSPFRGRLPQAPMSMERRLRNPITQVQFKKVDPSKQQDFMKQMREGIESGKTFRRSEVETKTVRFRKGRADDSDDEDFSPAKNRTMGSLDLAASKLRLPGDLPVATGLEDLFAGKSFGISDEPGVDLPAHLRRSVRLPWGWLLGVGAPVALFAIAWNIQPVRRAMCLWLAAKLQELGY